MPPEETITAPPVVEGTTDETVALEAQPNAQAPAESQETPTTTVDSGSKEPQVPEASRRKPSDYYRERQSIRELKETVALLRQKMEERDSPKKTNAADAPEVPDFDPAHFSSEHKRILAAREKALRDAYDAKFSAFEQRFMAMEESKVAAESERKHQEALEKLFPKSSPESKETVQERIAKNPERAERIRQLLLESGLNEASKINPDKVAKYVLYELGETQEKANPKVLNKALMGGAATGAPGQGTKRTAGEQDLLSEKNKLNAQLESNPSLRHDPKFMERREQVLSDIERLVTKK